MKYILYIFFLSFITAINCYTAPHIIFVHLGNTIPPYAYTALEQARLFNPQSAITLLANKQAIAQSRYHFENHTITPIACESLKESEWHSYFKKHSRLDPRGRDGFWLKATERFFYLHEYISANNLEYVAHMEYDNMLYANLTDMMDAFSHYKGIGAVFDCDTRCIPSFVYIANAQAIDHLVQFIAKNAPKGYNDMVIFAEYHKAFSKEYIDNLPLIMPEYALNHPLLNKKKQRAARPTDYWQHIDIFNSIFDGAAFGQYLGGIDPRNGASKPGFINETCLFNPSLVDIEWRLDEMNRKVPYAIAQGKAYRINNLHIHSKKLDLFKS